jgi:hypothetical protein
MPIKKTPLYLPPLSSWPRLPIGHPVAVGTPRPAAAALLPESRWPSPLGHPIPPPLHPGADPRLAKGVHRTPVGTKILCKMSFFHRMCTPQNCLKSVWAPPRHPGARYSSSATGCTSSGDRRRRYSGPCSTHASPVSLRYCAWQRPIPEPFPAMADPWPDVGDGSGRSTDRKMAERPRAIEAAPPMHLHVRGLLHRDAGGQSCPCPRWVAPRNGAPASPTTGTSRVRRSSGFARDCSRARGREMGGQPRRERMGKWRQQRPRPRGCGHRVNREGDRRWREFFFKIN